MNISKFEIAKMLPFVESYENRWEKTATAFGGLFRVRKDKTTNCKHYFIYDNEVFTHHNKISYHNHYNELYSQRFKNNSLSYLKDIVKEQFKFYMGVDLNLDNPKTFSEKLNWMKVYYHNPLMTICADKVRCKEYILDKAPELAEHFIENYGIFDSVEDINFDALPKDFVLKANWGSGAQMIVKNKDVLNIEQAKIAIHDWLHPYSNHYYVAFEYGYKNIVPKIICEKFINYDYKIEFFCFNGVPTYYWIIFNDKTSDVMANFYTIEGNKLPLIHKYPNFTEHVDQPIFFETLVSQAKKLSADFPFVRVDFYKAKETYYFCELTFVHWAGLMPFTPDQFDIEFGKILKLPSILIDEKTYII